MQTFLPYPDFQQSAQCLDDRRLGKQRVECLQILNTLAIGPYQYFVEHKWLSANNVSIEDQQLTYCRKTPWYNHPATKMWRGYEWELLDYCTEIIIEWKSRGFKDNCFYKLNDIMAQFPYRCVSKKPDWLGSKEFHLSHQSNLIRKNPSYYRPIFGSEVPDNLPYIWSI